MSADAHVASSRLRGPAVLSTTPSSSLARRRTQGAQPWSVWERTARAAGGGGGRGMHSTAMTSEGREGLASRTAAGPSTAPYDVMDADDVGEAGGASGTGNGGAFGEAEWLDIDRFEDWERPTLENLRPDIRIPYEDEVFPLAAAEDGETLPSDLHPSHPFGDVHLPMHHQLSQPTLRLKQQQQRGRAVAPNPPHWPFPRYGPARPLGKKWRPYRPVWAEVDLATLAAATKMMDESNNASPTHFSEARLASSPRLASLPAHDAHSSDMPAAVREEIAALEEFDEGLGGISSSPRDKTADQEMGEELPEDVSHGPAASLRPSRTGRVPSLHWGAVPTTAPR